MSNIILIGMPASGKSTIGVLLAKTLGMYFLDTDLLIQQKENMLLQDIINIKGNDYFRKIEEEVLIEIDVENTVISTGGSAVYYEKAMATLKKKGTVIYLETSLASIKKRLRNIKTRGITMAPGQTIKDLYDTRVPLYEKEADITIKTQGFTPEETIEEIIKMLQ